MQKSSLTVGAVAEDQVIKRALVRLVGASYPSAYRRIQHLAAVARRVRGDVRGQRERLQNDAQTMRKSCASLQAGAWLHRHRCYELKSRIEMVFVVAVTVAVAVAGR